MTPAGLQQAGEIARRRRLVAVFNAALYLGLLLWLWAILSVDGWSLVDIAFFIAFAVAAPWAVVGAVNATLGLWLLRFKSDGLAAAAPFADPALSQDVALERVALIMTLRNEDPARALSRLEAMAQELSATPQADRFSYFVLSDTSLAHVAAAEEAYVAQWRQRAPTAALHYRRRADNEGFKAGNVRAFCRDHYETQDCMIALDADSRMDAATILRLARIAARWPQIGVLQSLVVGAPSKSAFARLFQFGMRAGMRSYTMGGAWWGADCGPFWGHNALVRVRPFYDHCALPTLPGKPPFGGAILSHDQVEAVLMRRAGFEVRVLPEETGSYEDNPPDMLEFSQRDMRWCQGNMQYGPIIRWPGLKPMSRFQLVWAILMFLGLPASFLLIFLAALKPFDGETHFPAAAAIGFWSFYLLLGLAPKLGGFIDALADKGARRYGGPLLFLANAALELVGSFLLSAPVGFRTALFMAGLPFGANLGWGAQNRDGGGLALRDCARAFWPGSLFGALCLGLIAFGAPGALVFALPYAAGLVLAIPFAWVSARPGLGLWMQRHKICAIPEEIAQR